MKILLLAPSPFFQLRGTPIAEKLLAEVLTAEGHQVHMLTYHEGESVDLPNFTLSRIPSLPGIKNIKPGPSWKKLVSDMVMFVKLLRVARKNRFDLIHAVEESVFMALIIKKLFGIPFVYDLDSSLSQQITEKYRVLKPIKPFMEHFEKMAIRGSLGTVTMCKALEDVVLTCDAQKLMVRLEDISLLPDEPDHAAYSEKPLGDEPVVMYMETWKDIRGSIFSWKAFK